MLATFMVTGFTASAETAKPYITVVIDPGHGGDDPGSSNQTYHVNEREVNLKIAQYFKAELETYAGVKVYMTRCDNTDKSLGTGGDGLRKRAEAAENYGADVIISVHCNANEDKSVRGAEVYYQNESRYYHEFHTQGKLLAEGILSNLASLGISNRGAKTRNSTDGETYDDGHLADYYTLLISSRLRGIMGLIVEHAFISTNTDYNDFLSTDAKLKKLGIADASAVAKHYNLRKKQDPPIADGTYLITAMSDKESVLGENNGVVGLAAETREDSQLFNISATNDGTYKIINKSTGLALTKKDGEVTLEKYSDAANQKWALNSVKNTEFYCIENNENFLTCDNTLKLAEYGNTENQRFLFVPVSDNIGDKSVLVASKLDPNKVLDIYSAGRENNANCQIYDENRSDAQIFDLKYSNGYYTIENQGSHKVLTVNETAVNYGANVYQYESTGSVNQKWILKQNSDASYSFISRANGLCMDVENGRAKNLANIQVYQPNGSDAQKFILINEKYADIKSGVYRFGSSLNGGKSVMDVANASTKSGGNIWLFENNNSPAQRFRIEKTTLGYYKITSVLSGMSLDVTAARYNDGTNLQQFTFNDSLAQRWIIEENEDSTYTIISRCNGKAIDVYNADTANGTNIHLYRKNNSPAQAFIFSKYFELPGEIKRSVTLTNGTYLIAPMSDKQSVLGENDGAVGLAAETGGNNQLFEVSTANNGTYKIINKSTGLALTKKDGEVTLEKYSASNADQKWTLNGVNNTEFYCIRNGEKFITCDESLKLAEYGSTENQKFLFVPASQNIGDKSVLIANKLDVNKVLDIYSAGRENNANCQIYDENRSDAQIFDLKYSNGYYTIENQGSHKVLTVNETAVNYGANVYQYESTGSVNQKWILKQNSDASYSFISRANGLCIDVMGGRAKNFANIQAYQPNGSDAQNFILINEKNANIASGIYCFGSSLNGGKSVMDVANASTKSGGNIWLFEKNNSFAQRFRIEKTTLGYYKITSVLSGMSLDVTAARYNDGTNLQQFTFNDSLAQRWIIEENEDSTYTIISRCNGKAIDVYNADTANGTNIHLYRKNNSPAQAFTIDGVYAIMDSQQASIDRMVEFYNTNSKYSYNDYLNALGDKRSAAPATLREFCKLYCDEANFEGVKPEVAFCQAMHETGWLRYGGDVLPTQFNFAGIGATGKGEKGAVFKDARTGIMAHIQHLKAYASKDSLKNPCVDPRFIYVNRGCATHVTDLGGKWAVSPTYGDRISALIDKLIFKQQ